MIKSAFLLFDALTDKWVSNFFIVKPNDYSAKLAINTDNLPTKTTTVLTLPSGDLNLNNVFSTDQTNPQTFTGGSEIDGKDLNTIIIDTKNFAVAMAIALG
jgi:hypothetical protein